MDRGQRLRELREHKRLSQTEAARHVGVSKQTLYKYENNIITNIPSDVIERFAVLYETTPGFIMGWEDRQTLADRLSSYDPQTVIRALDFIDSFRNVDPETQAAIELLLKSRRSDS